MSEVLYVAVPVASIVVFFFVMLDVRRVDSEGRPVRPRIRRRHWLGLAAALLVFAAGDFLILLIDGGLVKQLALIVPALLAAGWFVYKAQTTPA